MFSRKLTIKSTESYSVQLDKLKEQIKVADAIIIGAGSGLSTSAGLTYSGERFKKHFSDFENCYGFHDMYSGGFYSYNSLEEYWAYWSRQIYVNRYDLSVGKPYMNLLEIVNDKDYFVLTTNVDHQFQLAGFDKHRLFYTQGDYGLWQCSVACHDKTYDNEKIVRQMISEQVDLRIPTELIPHCPICEKPMTMNLRCDNSFVEDNGWHIAHTRYVEFIQKHQNTHILFLEFGVGANTPSIIKYPFWQMTRNNPHAFYVCVNLGEAVCPKEIENRAMWVNSDIGYILEQIKK